MIVRTLSLLSIACIAAAVILVLTTDDSNTPVVIVLVLVAFGITTLLGIRRGYHKVRGIVDDARPSSPATSRGPPGRRRRPEGIFNPESTVVLELEGEDGTRTASSATSRSRSRSPGATGSASASTCRGSAARTSAS